jgi:hypothetical protein
VQQAGLDVAVSTGQAEPMAAVHHVLSGRLRAVLGALLHCAVRSVDEDAGITDEADTGVVQEGSQGDTVKKQEVITVRRQHVTAKFRNWLAEKAPGILAVVDKFNITEVDVHAWERMPSRFSVVFPGINGKMADEFDRQLHTIDACKVIDGKPEEIF